MKKRSLGKSLKVMVVCAESWICIWGANAEVHSKAVTHAFGTAVRGRMLVWKDHGPGNTAGFRVLICWLVPMT